MNTSEQDDLVQSMRDQGIADACEGRVARFKTINGVLSKRIGAALYTPVSGFVEIDDERFGTLEYRSAFAYARAYASEKGAE